MVANGQKGNFKCHSCNFINGIITLPDRGKQTHQLLLLQMSRVLPEAHSVAQGCVTVAIFSIDRSSMTQKVLHQMQMALTGSDMQGCTSIIVTQTEVTAL